MGRLLTAVIFTAAFLGEGLLAASSLAGLFSEPVASEFSLALNHLSNDELPLSKRLFKILSNAVLIRGEAGELFLANIAEPRKHLSVDLFLVLKYGDRSELQTPSFKLEQADGGIPYFIITR